MRIHLLGLRRLLSRVAILLALTAASRAVALSQFSAATVPDENPAVARADGAGASAGKSAVTLDATALAARIDQLFAESWTAETVKPAPPTDDAEFLRRVYLDLAGKIPPVAEARTFLDDRDPEKRRKLVERLLGKATFAAHLARTYRDLMLPGANNNFQTQFLVPSFEAWLRLRIANDTPWDKLVTELLTATSRANQPAFNLNSTGEPSPAAFFQANELKPENIAAATSKIFLGVQLQCAQCHDHPFARWSKEQFWSLASFFKGVGAGQADGVYGAVQDATDRDGIEIPGGKGEIARPRFLDGNEPEWRSGEGKRATLARWIVTGDNPYFARAAANRVWAQLFGRGLVDPVDDLDEANPPSHPEVLDELARQLTYHNFDLKYLFRAITATRAYQLSSMTTHASQDDPRHFARMSLRSMTGDQLFDSFVQATGFEEATPNQRNAFILGATSARATFLGRFSDTGPTRTDYQASILQALTLMNGDLMASATSLTKSELLQGVLDAPFLDTPKRLDILFLATLTRRPTADESTKMTDYINRAGSDSARKQAIADIFWALLNSAEFALNH